MTEREGDSSGWHVPGGEPRRPEASPDPGAADPPASRWQVPGGGESHAEGGPPAAGSAWAPPDGPAPWAGGPGAAPPPRTPQPGIVALRRLTLGDMFNGAFGYIRRNPRATLGLSVIVMALSSAVVSYGGAVAIADTVQVFEDAVNNPAAVQEEPAPLTTGTLLSTWGGAALDMFAAMILTGLLTVIVGHAVLGRRLSLAESWRLSRGRLPAVIGVTLLVSLIVLVLTVVGGGAVLAAAAAFGAIPAVIAAVAVALPLLAASVWLYVRFALAVPAVVLEGRGPLAAMARSWELSRGSWWRVCGILLLAMLLIMVVQQVLATPFFLASGGISFLGGEAAWVLPASSAAMFLGTLLLSAFTYPFVTGVTVLLYLDLRMRREGLDLELQAAARSGDHIDERVFVPGAMAGR